MPRYSAERIEHRVQIGDCRRDGLCGEARKLIAGGCDPTGRLIGLRGDTVSLSGSLWWFAGRYASETTSGGPNFAKWKPFKKFDKPEAE